MFISFKSYVEKAVELNCLCEDDRAYSATTVETVVKGMYKDWMRRQVCS